MKKFFVIAGACLLSACNPQKDNNPISNIAETAKDVKLVGRTFFADCGPSGLGAQVQGLQMKRVSYKFEGANVTRTTSYYDSNDCTGAAGYSLHEIGQMNIMTDKQTPYGARFLDLNFNQLNVEIVSQGGAEAANTVLGLCGKKDWRPGQRENMTAVAAQANCLNKKLELERQIYRVEGDVLIMGDLGVTSAMTRDQQGRPTTLDRTGMKFVAGK